jgi:predicted acyltransferase
MNALTIYLVQRVVGFRQASSFLFGWLGSLMPSGRNSVVVDVGYVVLCWLFLLVLYRNKLFFKV